MNREYTKVPLRTVLRKVEEPVAIAPDETYKQVTVRLFHKGVVLRGKQPGAEIRTTRQWRVRAGQILLSRIDARNGAIGLVSSDLDGAIVTNDFWTFEVDKGIAEPRFLDAYFATSEFVEACKRASEGTTNRVRLQLDRFLKIEVPLPPLVQQRRIVGRIEELSTKIEEVQHVRRQAVDEAENLYTSILASVFLSRSDSWQQEMVADVIISIDAGWSPACENRPAADGEWGVLKTTSVQWCEFRPYENKVLTQTLTPRPDLCVQVGDVLVTRAGPRKRVGVIAAARVGEPCLMISDKLIRLRPDHSKIESRFVELSLCSPLSQEHLVQRKTGLADAQVNISQGILLSTPVTYPGLPEQRRIVAYLDDVQTKAEGLRKLQAETATELDALLPSILDKAFKGQLL